MLDSDDLLRGYAAGIFPMDGPGGLRWYRPWNRAVIPLDASFHVSKTLARTVRSGRFRITTDTAFETVMRACAAPRLQLDGTLDPDTWISERIVAAYTDLHRRGYGHSVEVWSGDELAGGLYGVALGGAFFGESMFHRARDASKVALVHLVERLRRGGFVLLDTQFLTDHLAQFGAYEMPRRAYEQRLAEALRVDACWLSEAHTTSGDAS
ncbi:MAG: leucyl/phenylalanyl-tRNA--protein transferase [Rhodothermales bacterium]|nr:leucyl/phenylalanyl-tRNA--protein transferase [Rhodothermales bacterium]MCA0268443.1 leucyl/phenylalanyl-tRNA--protein transferase [Bacteroidota bacterium]